MLRMINYFISTDGKMRQIESYQEDCWLQVVAPSEKEITALIEQFDLEPDYIRASLDEEESSRIESEDGKTLIIIDAPICENVKDDMIYSTVPIGIIVTEKNVITVTLNENPIVSGFAQGYVKGVQTNLKTRFVLQLMLKVAMRFLQYLKQIDKLSSSLEKQLRKSMKNKELIELLDIEKSLVYFSTSLKADESTIEKLGRGRYLKMYEEDRDLHEDVLVELKQAIEMSNIYLNIMSGTMDAFASVISNNLNVVMKVLASITIVISVPNIISSFYGMNVDGLPLKEYFWFPVVLAGVIMLVLAFILKKKDMM